MKKYYKKAPILLSVLLAAFLFISIKSNATTQSVNVSSNVFTPSSFTINIGDTVKWVWVSGTHTTTSQTIPSGAATWNHNINSSAGNTSFTYVPTVLGTYNYHCNIHSATMLGSFTVVCPAASVTISAGGATTFCSGGSVVLSKSSVPTFTTYQWELDGAIISGETNTSYTATASGSYTLTVTNSCGNTATSAGIAVTVNTAPTAGQATITAGGPTSFCGSTGVLLSVATSGLTYQWLKNGANISGQTNQSYTAKATATFSCNVSNSCGTTLSNSIATVKNTAPTSTVSQAPCSGGAVLLTCTPTPTTGITFQWKKGSNVQSGATNSTFSATSNGTYKCTVTITATGCTKTSAGSSVTITCKTQNQIANDQVIVYPNPSADYFVINTSSLDKNDAVMIYDLTGKLLEHYSINGEEIKVGATLTNGIYFARIENNGAIQQVIKLVKNR